MQLSDKSLREFIEIYKKEVGETLSLEEAREIASRLVHLYVQLARPLPGEKRAETHELQFSSKS